MRRRVLLAVVIGGLIGLVAGTVLLGNSGMSCDEWKGEYARAVEETRGGILAYINEGPGAERLRELEDERPEGCLKP